MERLNLAEQALWPSWAVGAVVLGNGTDNPTTVPAGTNGNVLTDNGSAWVSAAPSGGGGGGQTVGDVHTVSAAGTITLTVASAQIQVITGATTETVVLPTTSVTAGMQWQVINLSTGVVTVNASGGATVWVLAGNSSAVFTANAATPTTAAGWDVQYGGVSVASGKLLTISNTLSLSGTDNTVYNLDSLAPGVEVVTVSSATTLTLTSASTCYVFTGASATTWTLPAVTGNTGRHLILENRGSANITVVPAGTDHIWYLAAITTFTVIAGGSLHLIDDGTYWETLSVDLADNVAGVLPKANGGTGSNTGALTPPAGTATVAPLLLASGTNLTTPAAGAVEYDGTVLYFTPKASARHVVHEEQFETLTAAYTLASQTAAQKLFNATANGAVTLQIGTYFFDAFFTLSAMSATSGSFGFALAGTATIAGQLWQTEGNKAVLATAASAQNTTNVAANAAIVTATTATVGWAHIWGKVRISAAGTLIPQVSLGVAAAAIVGADSFFRIWPLGLNTVTNVGNWS